MGSRAYGKQPRESRCPGTSSPEGRERAAPAPSKSGHEIDPQTDRIDVPAGKGETPPRRRARLITLKRRADKEPHNFLKWPKCGWNHSALAYATRRRPD